MSDRKDAAPASFAPFLLDPIPVPRVWGGDQLLETIHPSLAAPLDDSGAPLPVGETWEISDVGEDPALHSVIRTGPWQGQTLRALFREFPREVLGAAGGGLAPDPELPLLFKYIDAGTDLSVQVHPSDELLAARGEPGRGKTEAWVILDAAPGARLIVGFDEGWDLERYRESARAGDGRSGLREVTVSRGDVVFLPAGLVHAIGGGIQLAEIQQSSDITWRLYDWDRVGLDGAPRTLHLEECAGVEAPDPIPACPLEGGSAPGRHRAIDGTHFRLELLRGDAAELPLERRSDRFGILALLEGDGVVLSGAGGELPLTPYSTAFVPAAASSLTWRSDGPIWALWMEPGDA